jgi:hypothetical protein
MGQHYNADRTADVVQFHYNFGHHFRNSTSKQHGPPSSFDLHHAHGLIPFDGRFRETVRTGRLRPEVQLASSRSLRRIPDVCALSWLTPALGRRELALRASGRRPLGRIELPTALPSAAVQLRRGGLARPTRRCCCARDRENLLLRKISPPAHVSPSYSVRGCRRARDRTTNVPPSRSAHRERPVRGRRLLHSAPARQR